jgi:hypothetical protein
VVVVLVVGKNSIGVGVQDGDLSGHVQQCCQHGVVTQHLHFLRSSYCSCTLTL